VQQLAIHTVGGVVTPAQALLAVAPSDSPIEVEAMASNRDIGFVQAGQRVEIKVDTFNFTRYGLLHGNSDSPLAVGTRDRDVGRIWSGVTLARTRIDAPDEGDRLAILDDDLESPVPSAESPPQPARAISEGPPPADTVPATLTDSPIGPVCTLARIAGESMAYTRALARAVAALAEDPELTTIGQLMRAARCAPESPSERLRPRRRPGMRPPHCFGVD
jgi:hypothetical protein